MDNTTKKLNEEVLELPKVQEMIKALRLAKIAFAAMMNPKTDVFPEDTEEIYVAVSEALQGV